MNPLDTVDLIENNFYKTETVLCNIKKKMKIIIRNKTR